MNARTTLLLAAAVAAPACSARAPCRSDADCGTRSVCVAVRTAPDAAPERRCTPTCASDADCVVAGSFGSSCRPLQDSALGPASVEPRVRVAGHRADVERTTRSAIKVCRNVQEPVK